MRQVGSPGVYIRHVLTPRTYSLCSPARHDLEELAGRHDPEAKPPKFSSWDLEQVIVVRHQEPSLPGYGRGEEHVV